MQLYIVIHNIWWTILVKPLHFFFEIKIAWCVLQYDDDDDDDDDMQWFNVHLKADSKTA